MCPTQESWVWCVCFPWRGGSGVGNVLHTLLIRGAVYCRKVQQYVMPVEVHPQGPVWVTTVECGTVCLWEMLGNIHSSEFVAGTWMLTKIWPLIGSLAPAPALRCLPGVGRIWCALPRKVWCAFPRGESCVPPLEGRVWCALPRRGGSGVPSPGGEGLVCPLQEGSALPSKCYSYCHYCYSKLSPSCLINKLRRSSYS